MPQATKNLCWSNLLLASRQADATATAACRRQCGSMMDSMYLASSSKCFLDMLWLLDVYCRTIIAEMGISSQPRRLINKYVVPKFKDPNGPLFLQGRSQIRQDQFVVAMTRGSRGGSFLEIGAGHPEYGNNTYLLETQYDYQGISVEIVCPDYEKFFTQWYHQIRKPNWPDCDFKLRSLPTWLKAEIEKKHNIDDYARYHDQSIAVQRNNLANYWKQIRSRSNLITKDAFDIDYSTFPDFFTYLQIDIEPPDQNLEILQKICSYCDFAVITFEHDCYLDTLESKQALEQSRKFLSHQGYVLVAGRVGNFEDWWINPRHIQKEIYQIYLQDTDQILDPNSVLFV